MSLSRHDELLALKEIAETLNTSNDMQQMLQDVLKKLLEVTQLSSGWIFLVEDQQNYTCVADHNLPPAFLRNDKQPMKEGFCWCLNRFWDGRLKHAVNIINCKRIENAIHFQWGETLGISHHASVPLREGDEMFGILNVAAPHKEQFTAEELALLQSVAYQIGVAIKRTKLYHIQQKRAENYARLGEVSRQLGAILDMEKLPSETVKTIGKVFKVPFVGFIIREDAGVYLRTYYLKDELHNGWIQLPLELENKLKKMIAHRKPVILNENQHLASVLKEDWTLTERWNSDMSSFIPLTMRESVYGFLWLGSHPQRTFTDHDEEILWALGEHVSLALENARLYTQRREIAKMEERNRLARDLHDSVTQMLFSLSLTAKGTELFISKENSFVYESLQEIQTLAQLSLKEMRALIRQLRPLDLEEGLVTALKRYAKLQGLEIHDQVTGIIELPTIVEETLWRIGQEAINNVQKHAGTNEVNIHLKIDRLYVTMEISDNGCGFNIHDAIQAESSRHSFGLLSMRERAEMLGGTCTFHSVPGKGTVIRVNLPIVDVREKSD